MKKYLRFLIVAVVLTIVASALCCCAKTEAPSGPETDPIGDVDQTTVGDIDTTAPDDIQPVLCANLSQYYVIRKDECSSEISSVTASLCNAIKNKFGDGISITTDFYLENNDKYSIKEYEILVGETNREESISFIKGLKANDYGYTVIGRKIVIAGGTDEATIKAVEKFTSDIVDSHNTMDEVFLDKEQSYVFRSEYLVDDILINGKTSIGDYTIVYKYLGKQGERELAQSLSSTIKYMTGHVLDVVSDKDESSNAAEILVGVTNREVGGAYSKQMEDGGYCIMPVDNHILLWGTTPFATMSAVNDFVKLITSLSGPNEKITLNVSETLSAVSGGSDVSAMSFNVWVGSRSNERDARVVQMVLDNMPDVVGFQEVSSSWLSVLVRNLGSYYAYVGEGRDGGGSGEYNPIFYRKDKFKLIDSGTRWLSDTPDKVSKYSQSSLNRIYTYARLERISDGVEFLHINTHFDHKSSEARELQSKVLLAFINENKGVPMFITGDFNCTSSSAEYKTVISGGVSDSSDIAKKKSVGATFHNYGSSSKIIDFIFVDSSKIYVSDYKVCNQKINGDYASDHHPVYIEFNIAG